MSYWPPEFNDFSAIVAVHYRSDGEIHACNRGFQRLVQIFSTPPSHVLRQPSLVDLLTRSSSPGEVLFHGFLTFGTGGIQDLSLRGQVRRHEDGLTLLAEYDPEIYDRTSLAITQLNTELAEAHRRLIRELHRRHQAENERDAKLARIEELRIELSNLHDQIYSNPLPPTQTLRQANPVEFAEVVQNYVRILLLALEQRDYRVDHSLSDRLRELTDRVGKLACGARDVIEIHTAGFRIACEGRKQPVQAALMEEGRLLVLEFMGELLGYYRRLTWNGTTRLS